MYPLPTQYISQIYLRRARTLPVCLCAYLAASHGCQPELFTHARLPAAGVHLGRLRRGGRPQREQEQDVVLTKAVPLGAHVVACGLRVEKDVCNHGSGLVLPYKWLAHLLA